jgi:hypothetical protein
MRGMREIRFLPRDVSGGLPNAAFALMGGILFAVGMAMFVSARRAEGA